ncbi:hypothetical protein QR98_0095270 [Sarcoptes scabiei]|uniref:Uncharacterized protein n=1 Tax=Sarcoptes scabiei TaxID=52283 RepID=A0A132AJ03_SARSC|nr:hypothetical protein QR98_0095270 [Sarcoptes scabiei]
MDTIEATSNEMIDSFRSSASVYDLDDLNGDDVNGDVENKSSFLVGKFALALRLINKNIMIFQLNVSPTFLLGVKIIKLGVLEIQDRGKDFEEKKNEYHNIHNIF